MTPLATIYHPSGGMTFVRPKVGNTFSCEELQKYVGGDFDFTELPDGTLMFVCQESNGQPNAMATRAAEHLQTVITGRALVCEKNQIE